MATKAGNLDPSELRREARTEAYRQLIYDAAEELFADQGYASTRVHDIADSSGLSIGTLYGIIQGKKGLFRAIHKERGKALLKKAKEIQLDENDPLGSLLDGIAAYVEFLANHPNYLRLHLQTNVAWALGPEEANKEQYAAWKAGHAIVSEAFRRAIEQGSVVREDPEVLASTMMATHQVYFRSWLDNGMKESAESLVYRLQENFMRTFCYPVLLDEPKDSESSERSA